jgi:hypothetical protein
MGVCSAGYGAQENKIPGTVEDTQGMSGRSSGLGDYMLALHSDRRAAGSMVMAFTSTRGRHRASSGMTFTIQVPGSSFYHGRGSSRLLLLP